MKKECSKCHQGKDISEFTRDKNKKDGLQVWCKSCKKEYTALYNKKIKAAALARKRYAEKRAKEYNFLTNKKEPRKKSFDGILPKKLPPIVDLSTTPRTLDTSLTTRLEILDANIKNNLKCINSVSRRLVSLTRAACIAVICFAAALLLVAAN